jgi:hypothetical protein
MERPGRKARCSATTITPPPASITGQQSPPGPSVDPGLMAAHIEAVEAVWWVSALDEQCEATDEQCKATKGVEEYSRPTVIDGKQLAPVSAGHVMAMGDGCSVADAPQPRDPSYVEPAARQAADRPGCAAPVRRQPHLRRGRRAGRSLRPAGSHAADKQASPVLRCTALPPMTTARGSASRWWIAVPPRTGCDATATATRIDRCRHEK